MKVFVHEDMHESYCAWKYALKSSCISRGLVLPPLHYAWEFYAPSFLIQKLIHESFCPWKYTLKSPCISRVSVATMHESFMRQVVAYHTARFGVAPLPPSGIKLESTDNPSSVVHTTPSTLSTFHTKYCKLHSLCILHAEHLLKKNSSEFFSTMYDRGFNHQICSVSFAVSMYLLCMWIAHNLPWPNCIICSICCVFGVHLCVFVVRASAVLVVICSFCSSYCLHLFVCIHCA